MTMSLAEMQQGCSNKAWRIFAPPRGTSFEPGALELLTTLPRLRFVHLFDCRLNEADLVSLGKLKRLDRLAFDGSPLKDDWLRHLSAMPKLKDFWLENTGIGDAALAHVER